MSVPSGKDGRRCVDRYETKTGVGWLTCLGARKVSRTGVDMYCTVGSVSSIRSLVVRCLSTRKGMGGKRGSTNAIQR